MYVEVKCLINSILFAIEATITCSTNLSVFILCTRWSYSDPSSAINYLLKLWQVT